MQIPLPAASVMLWFAQRANAPGAPLPTITQNPVRDKRDKILNKQAITTGLRRELSLFG
jgi:hypothetical protein